LAHPVFAYPITAPVNEPPLGKLQGIERYPITVPGAREVQVDLNAGESSVRGAVGAEGKYDRTRVMRIKRRNAGKKERLQQKKLKKKTKL